MHGGYFLRRQFATFLERHDGGLVTAFVHALVNSGHAHRHAFRRRVEVLHGRSRLLYGAVGERDSRFRRPVSLASVVERLMTLDLVLAHHGARFLVNESEKREYLAGLAESALPGLWIASARPGVPQHVRYFTDGRPVFIEPPDGHFCRQAPARDENLLIHRTLRRRVAQLIDDVRLLAATVSGS